MPAPVVIGRYGISRINLDFSRGVQSGFYFHPCDEDLSQGPRRGKSHLNGVLSVYSNSENAIAVEAQEVVPIQAEAVRCCGWVQDTRWYLIKLSPASYTRTA